MLSLQRNESCPCAYREFRPVCRRTACLLSGAHGKGGADGPYLLLWRESRRERGALRRGASLYALRHVTPKSPRRSVWNAGHSTSNTPAVHDRCSLCLVAALVCCCCTHAPQPFYRSVPVACRSLQRAAGTGRLHENLRHLRETSRAQARAPTAVSRLTAVQLHHERQDPQD